jgi:death-on-curing protein
MATTYLDLEDVLHMHAVQIERFGGSPGIRDAGLIEAALLRPQTGYYSDMIEEAAAMWESLTMNHGFIDGNKRIGLAATYTFLALNGFRMTASPDKLLFFILSNLEAGTFNKDNLDAWLRANTKAG